MERALKQALHLTTSKQLLPSLRMDLSSLGSLVWWI
ncbi:hypothetical protein Golax_000201 [Gossypium laxum]|uniref:Uncharacterized protein n=1 Tax=Gossypium laxum TaxID=34288 RepID=A0A7J9ASU5_9ROSI|nr:hypothetical protein [Gossypium laxum]